VLRLGRSLGPGSPCGSAHLNHYGFRRHIKYILDSVVTIDVGEVVFEIVLGQECSATTTTSRAVHRFALKKASSPRKNKSYSSTPVSGRTIPITKTDRKAITIPSPIMSSNRIFSHDGMLSYKMCPPISPTLPETNRTAPTKTLALTTLRSLSFSSLQSSLGGGSIHTRY